MLPADGVPVLSVGDVEIAVTDPELIPVEVAPAESLALLGLVAGSVTTSVIVTPDWAHKLSANTTACWRSSLVGQVTSAHCSAAMMNEVSLQRHGIEAPQAPVELPERHVKAQSGGFD